jgi:hypothetical protein
VHAGIYVKEDVEIYVFPEYRISMHHFYGMNLLIFGSYFGSKLAMGLLKK